MEDAEPLIEEAMTREPKSSTEVRDALEAAYRQRSKGGARFPRWPMRNWKRIIQIATGGMGVEGLRQLSPVKWTDGSRRADQVISALFPGNPLLCAGLDMRCVETRPRKGWRFVLHKCQFIVPNPMSKLAGVTKAGKVGAVRTEDNTGPRRFLIIECDFKEKDGDGRDTAEAPMLRTLAAKGITVADLCAAIILHLKRFMPLALVVHSGGKSLHAWFYVEGRPEKELEKFMRYAVSLGADRMLWQKCQLARMPDGTRENGSRQAIIYFQPEALQ
jgi:hypothetical protein